MYNIITPFSYNNIRSPVNYYTTDASGLLLTGSSQCYQSMDYAMHIVMQKNIVDNKSLAILLLLSK